MVGGDREAPCRCQRPSDDSDLAVLPQSCGCLLFRGEFAVANLVENGRVRDIVMPLESG